MWHVGRRYSSNWFSNFNITAVCASDAKSCLCRFVTRAELDKLGIGHLMGTPLLRAYMHGFFLHNRLWNKARAIAEPFMYDSYRKERVAEKLEAERKLRIGLKRKLPKVPNLPSKPCTLHEGHPFGL